MLFLPILFLLTYSISRLIRFCLLLRIQTKAHEVYRYSNKTDSWLYGDIRLSKPKLFLSQLTENSLFAKKPWSIDISDNKNLSLKSILFMLHIKRGDNISIQHHFDLLFYAIDHSSGIHLISSQFQLVLMSTSLLPWSSID